jgi:transcriptional regulator of acetoin/glycerol metabolism
MMRLFGGEEKKLRFSEAALAALVNYSWPGNLRQLSSTLRTLIVLCDQEQTIEIQQLPMEMKQTDTDLKRAKPDLKDATKQAIKQALEENGGCVSAAARQLGIHRSTLYRIKAKQSHRISGLTISATYSENLA